MGGDSYVDTACIVQAVTKLYYKYPKITDIGLTKYRKKNMNKNRNKKKNKKKNKRRLILIPFMVGNPLVIVSQKSHFPHFLPLSATDTMNNKDYGECK